MNIDTKLVKVTPTIAAKILENVHPRQKGRNSESVINLYAKQMKAGQWNEGVAQTVSIDSDGNLVDGWHRLNAIIRADVAITLLVARQVPPDAFDNYDAHQQRSLGFRLGLSNDRASEYSFIVELAKSPITAGRKLNAEIELAQEAFGATVEWFNLRMSGQKRRNLSVAPVRVGCILNIHRARNAETREQIVEAYSMMVNGNLKDAPRIISALHRRLLDSSRDRALQFALAFNAFNPRRFNDQKLQISNVAAVIREAQAGPLKELVGAIHD